MGEGEVRTLDREEERLLAVPLASGSLIFAGRLGFAFWDRFLHSALTRLFSFFVTFSSFSSLILFNVEIQLQQLCLLLWLLKLLLLLLILFRHLLLLAFELLIKFLLPLLLLLPSFTLLQLLLQSFLLLQDVLLGRRKGSNLQPIFHQLPSFTGTVWSHTRFIFRYYLLGCSWLRHLFSARKHFCQMTGGAAQPTVGSSSPHYLLPLHQNIGSFLKFYPIQDYLDRDLSRRHTSLTQYVGDLLYLPI